MFFVDKMQIHKYLPVLDGYLGTWMDISWNIFCKAVFLAAGTNFLGYNEEGNHGQSKFHVKHGWFCNLGVEIKNSMKKGCKV